MHHLSPQLSRRAIARLLLLVLMVSTILLPSGRSTTAASASVRREQQLAQLRARLAALPLRQSIRGDAARPPISFRPLPSRLIYTAYPIHRDCAAPTPAAQPQ